MLKIAMVQPQIRFKVISFSPFVPGVNDHDGFGRAFEGGAIGEYGAEPVAVGLGGEVVQDGRAAVAAASGVSPGGHHAGEAGVVDWGVGQHGGHNPGIGDHAAGA